MDTTQEVITSLVVVDVSLRNWIIKGVFARNGRQRWCNQTKKC